MKKRVLRSIVVGICAALLAGFAGSAQSSGQSGQSPQSGGQGGGQSQAAPSGGLSGGTAPIETTLFAYRALQSDAEAIAAKVIDAPTGDRLVIGSQADVSAFLQWRTVMGQADVLKGQLDAMHAELVSLNGSYNRATPLASLSISKKHSGPFVKGARGSYTILVSNSPAASATTGAVIVADTPPDGLTIVSMSGNGWTCNPPSGGVALNSCTRTDSLGPGAVYDPIAVTVNIAANAADKVTNVVTVSGSNSATASAKDDTDLTAASGNSNAGRRGLLIGPLAAAIDAGASGSGGGGGSTTPPSPFSTALSAVPTLTSLAQFIATSFAVNQTLSPWQGSMTDMPLINAVAGVLRRHGRTVFVPATYPPLAMTGADLRNTYLWQKLMAVKDGRVTLWRDIENGNALLMDANFAIQNPTKYAANDLNNALEYAGKAQSLLTSALALGTGVDSYIANLFGAQAPATGAGSPSGSGGTGTPGAGGNASGGSSSGGASAGSSSALSGSSAAVATPAGAPGGAQNASSGGPSPSQTAASVQQLLASDLLAHRIFESRPNVERSDIDTVNFLTVHALESGGSELLKSNIFYGTHIFFSGGSVATFSLYRLQGDLQCSGTALNYIGNVREKKVERRLMRDDVGHQARVAGFYCGDRKSGQISEGMTRGEVESTFGKPDRISQRGKVHLYKSRNLIVEFENGVVNRIRAAEAPAGSDSSQ
jgi:uncharacterized repeat protein (TIGR01451 family)